MYDVYAAVQDSGSTSSIKLHYRAVITQNTGEEWVHAPLILSTASEGNHSVAVPRLPTYRIKPRNLFFGAFGATQQAQAPSVNLFGVSPAPQTTTGFMFGAAANNQSQSVPLFGQAQSNVGGFGAAQPAGSSDPRTTSGFSLAEVTHFGAFGHSVPNETTSTQGPFNPPAATYASHQARASEHGLDPQETSTGAIPISEGNTRMLRTSPLSVSYAVNRPVKIPSDGAAHTVSVTTIESEAEISRICVPRVQTAVYLQCRVLNNSDYRLLAGKVNVFLNDAYVSQTSIKVELSS